MRDSMRRLEEMKKIGLVTPGQLVRWIVALNNILPAVNTEVRKTEIYEEIAAIAPVVPGAGGNNLPYFLIPVAGIAAWWLFFKDK